MKIEDINPFWPYRYFTQDEMRCKCKYKCGKLPKPELMVWLDTLRFDFGRPLIVNSGARCFKHNLRVGGVSESMHVLGLAADIAISGAAAMELLELALRSNVRGLGVYQNSLIKSRRFLHFDIRPGEKVIWSK